MGSRLIIDARKAFDSGIGTYVRNVVPRVCQKLRGVPISLLVGRGSGREHARYFAGTEVHMLDVTAPCFGPREQLELRRQLDRSAVFWATSLAHPLYMRGRLVAMVHDVAQLVLGAEGGVGLVTRKASRHYFESLRSRATTLLCNSEFTRSEFLRTVGAPAQASITVTPLGVDAEWASARPETRDAQRAPYFLCVANVRPHKNLGRLLSAFASVAARIPHELVIVGQSEGFRTADADTLRLLHELSPRTRFLGQIPAALLKSTVAGADAMVLPSLYEGFGLPALEAMSAGCPVIASTAGALAEVCGPAAQYFEPRSVESIASALVRHATQPGSQRSVYVAAGRERAGVFSWERTAELTAQAISQCL